MKSLNIWCLEDEEQILKGIKRFLEGRGHVVVGFGTVAEALQAFNVTEGKAELQPHVFLADCNLPDGTSERAVIKAKDAGVPRIIMMSGRPDENEPVARSLEVRFIEKPFTFQLLAYEIEEGGNPPISPEFVAEQGT